MQVSDGRGRLVISDEDLADTSSAPTAPPTAATQQLPAQKTGIDAPPPTGDYQSYPSVAGVKPAPLTVGGAPGASAQPGLQLGSTQTTSIIAGVAAILLGWAVAEIFASPDRIYTSESDAVGHVAVWVGLIGAVFGAVYSSWDKLIARLWEGAAPQAGIGALVGGIAGAISGAIAQSTYHSIVVSILKDSSTLNADDVRFYLARALAWAIFGVAVGAACAIAQRATRKLVNASLGGLVGGAVGGLFFQWLGSSGTVHDGTIARFLALAVIGGGIGAAIGFIETARRQAWVKIVAGGMAGKEFIVYHANANVGSSPKCEITLIKDPAIAAYHFRIDDQGGRRTLAAYDGCATAVNGQPVTSHVLRDGDVIQVGSTSMRYAERALAQ